MKQGENWIAPHCPYCQAKVPDEVINLQLPSFTPQQGRDKGKSVKYIPWKKGYEFANHQCDCGERLAIKAIDYAFTKEDGKRYCWITRLIEK